MVIRLVKVNISRRERAVLERGGRRLQAVAAADEHFAGLTNELDHFPVLYGVVLPDFRAVGIDVRLILRALVAFGGELDRPRVVHAESPLDDVEVMGAPVTVLAGAVFPEATPAAAVIAFDALLVVGIPDRKRTRLN